MRANAASDLAKYLGQAPHGSPATDANLPVFPSFKALSPLKLALNFIILNYNISTANS